MKPTGGAQCHRPRPRPKSEPSIPSLPKGVNVCPSRPRVSPGLALLRLQKHAFICLFRLSKDAHAQVIPVQATGVVPMRSVRATAWEDGLPSQQACSLQGPSLYCASTPPVSPSQASGLIGVGTSAHPFPASGKTKGSARSTCPSTCVRSLSGQSWNAIRPGNRRVLHRGGGQLRFAEDDRAGKLDVQARSPGLNLREQHRSAGALSNSSMIFLASTAIRFQAAIHRDAADANAVCRKRPPWASFSEYLAPFPARPSGAPGRETL